MEHNEKRPKKVTKKNSMSGLVNVREKDQSVNQSLNYD